LHSRTHGALHSFPTRRSSDLRWISSSPASQPIWYVCSGMVLSGGAHISQNSASLFTPTIATSSGIRRPSTWHADMKLTALWSWRSEEHTSELQSRENLVCRLL